MEYFQVVIYDLRTGQKSVEISQSTGNDYGMVTSLRFLDTTDEKTQYFLLSGYEDGSILLHDIRMLM